MAIETSPEAKADFEKAAAEAQAQVDGTEAEKPTTEETPEVEPTPEEVPTDELSEEEVTQARNLFRALKDPKTSSSVVAALAQQAGILAPPTTKVEEKEQNKTIQALLQESLGKEYEFLAPKLAPALEGALHQLRVENESRLEEVRRAGIEAEVSSAFDRLARETKGDSRKVERLMTELSEKIPAGSMSPYEYLQVLYVQAQHERGLRSEQERNKRINRNANDAASRLSATASGSKSEVPSKKMNINQAVEFAVSEVLAGRGVGRK